MLRVQCQTSSKGTKTKCVNNIHGGQNDGPLKLSMLGSPEPDDIPSVSQLQRQGRVKAMDGIKVANQLI